MLRCGSVSGGVSMKLIHQSKVISEKTFFFKRLLSEEQLLTGNIDRKLFGYD